MKYWNILQPSSLQKESTNNRAKNITISCPDNTTTKSMRFLPLPHHTVLWRSSSHLTVLPARTSQTPPWPLSTRTPSPELPSILVTRPTALPSPPAVPTLSSSSGTSRWGSDCCFVFVVVYLFTPPVIPCDVYMNVELMMFFLFVLHLSFWSSRWQIFVSPKHSTQEGPLQIKPLKTWRMDTCHSGRHDRMKNFKGHDRCLSFFKVSNIMGLFVCDF